MPPPQQLLSSCVSFKCLNLYLKVYLVLFILISALLPLSAPSDSISSSTSTSICEEALQWPDFCSVLKHSTHLSDSALKELTRREIEAQEMFCDMARLLTKIDCEQPYSVNVNQSLQCQSAYRDWACSMIAESIEVESGNDGRNGPSRSLISSCDSICHRVLRVCPYLTPDRYQLKSINNNSAAVLALHPSQYGGHPAFYCPNRSGLKFSTLESRIDGDSVSPLYTYRNASEVNLTDELINNNDTYCCWTYSEALKTEYVSLNEDEPSEFDRTLFREYDDESPNRVLIQCLHASSDTNGKEGQVSDGTWRESSSDFDKGGSGGGGGVGGGGASSKVGADPSDPQPSTLALSRAIKAADMEVTEGDTGLLPGDSSEANYYLRDDWFDVSPRSKSIQKRNNYNFLSLVSSSSKQHEQQSSSSVLSSGEGDDSEGLYGGPMIDDDNDNVGLLVGDHHHQSELELGKDRKETRRSRQEAGILDEEFISTVSVRVERSILQGQIGDPHQPSSAKSSAKSSASRQTLFIQFPVSLPTLKLPAITIHHNRCFPVLLFLLLIILLLILMVLLTTNFLPILLLYATPYVSSNFVVEHIDDDDERDRRWRAGHEIITPANPPVPTQLNSGLLVFREHNEINFEKNNNNNEYYYYYHYSNNTYSGAMLKEILTVRSQPSQYLVYIKLMISSQVQPWVRKLNKFIQWSAEKVSMTTVGAREHVVALVDIVLESLISVVRTSLLGLEKQLLSLLNFLREGKRIQGDNNNQSINYYYNICPKEIDTVVTNELTHGVTSDTISRTECPISRLRFVVHRLISSCFGLELPLYLFFFNSTPTPGCTVTVNISTMNMIRISSLWPSSTVLLHLLTPTLTRLTYYLTSSQNNSTRSMRRRVTSRNFSRPLLLLVLLTWIRRLVLLLITILMLLIPWSVVPHHHSIILITLLVVMNNEIMIRRGQSILPKAA